MDQGHGIISPSRRTPRAFIWTLCLCLVTGFGGGAAAEPSTGGEPVSEGQPGADALGKTKQPRRGKAPRRNPPLKKRKPKKAPKKKKKAPKTDDVGALAYDFGFTMGVLSGAFSSPAQKGGSLVNSWISSAQQARNALSKKVTFAHFKSVREDVGSKNRRIDEKKVIAARTRYQARIRKRRGKRAELAYIFGLQMGITEVIASNSAGMRTGNMRVYTHAVLQSLTESDLSKLGLDIALMQTADQHVGSLPLNKISSKQARNIHAAVLKARVAYRPTILKAPASFWAKK